MEIERPVTTEPRRAQIKTEYGSFRNDWLKSQGFDVDGKTITELKDIIREFYKANEETFKEALEAKGVTLDEEISTLAKKHLDEHDFSRMRERLDLPKWVSLAEAVAFIKTIIDIDDRDAQSRYAEYATTALSLNDMRRVLAFENDVKPARLDSDIYHQSPQRSRSVVEIASNAIDAMNASGTTIGRFGVGFYQILAHLKSDRDVVSVDTGNQENGFYRVAFYLRDNEIKVHMKELEEQSDGTTVELFSENFPLEEAEKLITKHFTYNNVSQVYCNGQLINDLSHFGIDQSSQPTIQIEISDSGYRVRDNGIGMSPQVILEKLLVPKFSGKKPVSELISPENIHPSYIVERSSGKTSGGKVVINVGGVLIEEIRLNGVNTARTMVIDLPPFTMLGEERNTVAIDDITIAATKKLIDQIASSGDVQLINSLTPVVAEFQNRSLKPEEENNMISYLQRKVQEIIPPETNCLPNVLGFERLLLGNTILIDPLAKQTNWSKIPGFETPKLDGEGWMLYVAPMSEQVDRPIIAWRNRVILSEKIYQKFADDPTLINLYLGAYAKGEGIKVRQINQKGKERPEAGQSIEGEKREYRDFSDYLLSNWNSLGYPNLDTAEAFIEKMPTDVRDRGQLIHKYIIPNFPEPIINYFIDILLRRDRESATLSEENLSSIASISSNPELVRTLVELDVHFRDHQEPERTPFPGISGAYPEKTNDPEGRWYKVKYWDRENLIHESGQVFSGEAKYGRSGLNNGSEDRGTFDLVALANTGTDGKLRFLDAATKEFHPIEFPMPKGAQFKCFEFGGKNYVAIGEHWYNHWSVQDREVTIYDFETGEVYNPAPDLGTPVAIRDDTLLYLKPAEKERHYHVHYYNADGTIETDNPAREERLLSEGIHKRLNDNTVELIIDGKVVHSISYEPDLDSKKRYNDDAAWERWWRHRISYMRDYYVKVEEIKQDDESFILWSARKETGEIVPAGYDLRENISGSAPRGSYSALEVENILFSKNGEEILRLEPNEKIIKTFESNGRKVFQVVQYNGPALYDEEDGTISQWPNVKETYYIDLRGQRLSSDEVATFGPIEFRTGARYEHGLISPIQGDTWKVKFESGLGRLKHGNKDVPIVTATIVDRESGSRLFKERMRNIVYDPGTDLWECHVYDGNTQVLDGKERSLTKYYYIDRVGKIAKERNVGYRERIIKENDDREWLYMGLQVPDMPHPLSYQQTEVMNRALESYETEDKAMMEKFIAKCSRYAELGEQAFSIIAPILLRVDFLDPRLIQENRILYLSGRLREFDLDNRVLFYDFLSQLLPPTEDDREIDLFAEKFLKVFQEKITVLPDSEKEAIYTTFGQVRDYGDQYLVTGWNIVRYQTPIGSELIPEKIRPLVDFLRSDEKTSFGHEYEPIPFNGNLSVTLSQLIQTKRLNERRMQRFEGTTEDLGAFVRERTEGKRQDHIRREIIHPIYYQSVNNPYLFIRELVQNAHDAVIKNKELENKNVAIDIFTRVENEVTLRIEDPVGMSLQEVLNYFLIPGETTKLGDQETIGYFGQGLFTLFRGAKEVILKTSKGDGMVTKLRITPLVDDKGMTADLQLELEQEEGEFRGTVIERTLDSRFPEVEAAYVKNATCSYTSLVDANVVGINLNESQINRPQQLLASIEIPNLGRVALYDAPNNVITQRGLFIKSLDDDYKTGLRDVEDVLNKRGYVLSIPDHVSLTRSRNEIARKEEVIPEIQQYLPLLKLQAYLEIFRQDIVKGHVIQLDNLPYDYFYMNYPSDGPIYNDSLRLRNGEPILNVEPYLERGSLIQLLILLPIIELDGQTWSLAELKHAALEKMPPLEDDEKYKLIPTIIREKLLEGRAKHQCYMEQRRENEKENRSVPDFDFEEWKQQPHFVRAQISENLDAYTRMYTLAERLNLMLAMSFNKDQPVRTSFFFEPGNMPFGGISIAHAWQGWTRIGWNLDYWKSWQMHSFRENRNASDRELAGFLDTYSHEYGHIMEKSGAMTHNQTFYRRQAEALSRIMHELLKSPDDKKVTDLI